MKGKIVWSSLLLLVSLTACTTYTAPSTQTGSVASTQVTNGSIQVPGTIPSDENGTTVSFHVQDRCPPNGPLTSGSNGGRSAFPLTLTFSGPRSFQMTSETGDFTAVLEDGHWTLRSVTAPPASGVSGYQPTDTGFDVPQQTSVTANQIRDCGGATPPPPVVIPPPNPPPPCTVENGCIPPPTCQEQHPPAAGIPLFNGHDGTATVTASNEGDFTLSIHARYTDPTNGQVTVWNDKAHETIHLACGLTRTWTARYANWSGHIAQEWWAEVDGPGIHLIGEIYRK